MRKLQCKDCNRYGFGENGRVVKTKIEENCLLPGPIRVSSARIYTVECSSCHRKWQYRRKIK